MIRTTTPGGKPRSLGWDTLIYGFGVALSRAASVIMLPIYTRYLTPADYGVLNLLQMTMDIVAIALTQGIGAAVFRYYFKATTDRERHQVVSSALWIGTAGKVLGALVAVLCAPWIAASLLGGDRHVPLVYMTAAAFALNEFTGLPMTVMQIQQRATLFTAASVGRLLLQLSLNILLVVHLEAGVAGVLISTVFTNAVTGAALSFWLLRQTGFYLAGEVIRRLVRFSIPLRLESLGAFFLTFGDRYFLKAFSGLSAVGVYGLAYQFGFVLTSMVSKPYFRAWDARRYQLGDVEESTRSAVYNEGFRTLSILTVSGAVGIALFARPFIQVMADPAFRSAADLVPLILFAQVFAVWSLVVEYGIYMSERTKFATYATGAAAASSAVLYPALIWTMDAHGAAIATIISAIVGFVARYRFSQKLWRIGYNWKPHWRLLAYGTAAVAAHSAFREADSVWIQLSLGVVLFIGYGILVWVGGVLEEEDRTWIRRRLSRLIGAVTGAPAYDS